MVAGCVGIESSRNNSRLFRINSYGWGLGVVGTELTVGDHLLMKHCLLWATQTQQLHFAAAVVMMVVVVMMMMLKCLRGNRLRRKSIDPHAKKRIQPTDL